MFGVRENPKIPPQIRKIIALKSAHLDRAYWHVISKKGNNSHLNPSCESNLLDFAQGINWDQAKPCKQRACVFFGVISCGPLTDYKRSQRWPQIRKKVDRISKFGPSNPQKRYIDLTNFGPQIRKIADTNHQELPGASSSSKLEPTNAHHASKHFWT